MTKTAFAIWNQRIAPVFDVARHVTIVEAVDGRVIRQHDVALPNDLPQQKAACLAGLGVTTLVCGAISRVLQSVVAAHGIRVIPFVAGDVADVVKAWLSGRLTHAEFAMPGCGGRRRQGRRGRCGGGGRRGAPAWSPLTRPRALHDGDVAAD
jgi:predicted Fe-Mo cluster-binding NifX family protein